MYLEYLYFTFTMNINQKSVKFLLKKIHDLEAELGQIKRQAAEKSRFNRKLCSENRKRRLANRELLQRQQSKLSMIDNLKTKQEQYNNIINSYTNALEESNKKLDESQEQILTLKTQITKEKQINYNLEVQIRSLKEKLQRKNHEIERLDYVQKEILYKKHTFETRQPSDSQDQLILLLCRNDELESKIKELEKINSGFLHKIENSEERIRVLLDELQSTKAILSLMNEEHKEEVSELNSRITQVYNNHLKQGKSEKILPSNILQTQKNESLINVIAKADEQNLSIAYGKRLQYKQQQFFSTLNVLYEHNIIQNYIKKPVVLHFCESIKNNSPGSWFARIKLTGYGEINFGISNRLLTEEAQNNQKHFLYYNNCSGLIVIDKVGKFIDKYCTKNETITMKITITSTEKVISFFMNDKQAYKAVIPAQLSKGDSFHPFVRLLGEMSIILR